MQFPITAQRVAQSALRPCKRRWIENNQIVLCPRFFSRTQELKDILLVPSRIEFVAGAVSLRDGDVLSTFFNAGYFPCPGTRTRQRKCSLVCEAIQHTPVAGVPRDDSIIMSLVEIETGLLTMHKIEFKLYAFDFDHNLGRSSAQNACL